MATLYSTSAMAHRLTPVGNNGNSTTFCEDRYPRGTLNGGSSSLHHLSSFSPLSPNLASISRINTASNSRFSHAPIRTKISAVKRESGESFHHAFNASSAKTEDTSYPPAFASFPKFLCAAAIAAATLFSSVNLAEARLTGVNRPELLPTGEFTKVIDVAGFLSSGQESRLAKYIENIEEYSGFKLRILAQNYPETPGLAIKDYWGVDDETIVFVADPSLGNIINFNVGSSVDLSVPRSFWSRVAGKYGNVFYWRENGEDASIEAAVSAIDACLREPEGPRKCAEVK